MVDKKTGLKPKASAKGAVVKGKKKAEVKQVAEVDVPSITKDEVAAEKSPIDKDQQIAETADEKVAAKEALTKAGKHSAKAIREAEELAAKEERKKQVAEAAAKGEKPKVPVKPAKSRLERAGKKFREAAKLVEKDKEYGLAEALELATKTSPTKFDATVELHVNLNVDPKQADQNVRDMVVLPAGSGKKVKIAAFVEGDDVQKAQDAGADIAGADTLIPQFDKEQFDFDILISTPVMMARLGKYARVLGPKGLMPNPKSGTVTADIAKAVKDAKGGRVEYRVDQAGIIHLGIGKVSFGADRLLQNGEAVMGSIRAAKPSSLKGTYIKTAYITTSMGPSIKVSAG